MASRPNNAGAGIPWRAIGWGGAAALLALPFIAMQFTGEVVWTLSDFIVFGAMILMGGIPLELTVRMSRDWSYRGGALLALIGMFLTIWANLAVGIVGSEHNPANLGFFAALLVGIAGSAIARFRANGMAIAMVATAASLGNRLRNRGDGTDRRALCEPLAGARRDECFRGAVPGLGRAVP